MLHAATMFVGLAVLWIAATQRVSSPQDWAIALGASLVCVLVALRFGGATGAFARAPRLLVLSLARASAVLRGALATLRAAISADVKLKPALVRLRTRAERADDRAAFANMISATPGMVVVDSDADGLLVHVADEDAIDATDLGRLEAGVIGGAR
ncbi:MAG: Na+/H+ antiporter subunit E [Alphaproteobacteria bacterium]|nr:Na+/H+ antiporter subunit E [Alphaproteobacteria bacterium]